ncbi:Aldo/keto reductase [Marasmius fiardii PR-910]|nr:Aldo/keto reductase [Marasmius fiardii PR-910]
MKKTSLTLNSRIKLRNDEEIPVLGFGTYELDGDDAYEAVLWALEAGYRHIDSAEWYENERECGKAILDFCKQANIPRSDIFYTTKLKYNDGYDAVKQSIEKSLELCGLGYIDLYLIHGPIGGPQARLDSWRAICAYQKLGKLKNIGISTYGTRHIQELIQSGLPLPVIHQIDLHPFQTRNDIVSLSREHGIILEAWAPLVRGLRFDHPVIAGLSKKYGKEPAQVLLRYSLQKGYVAIPKSSSKKRIVSNTKIFDFELEDQEVGEMDGLNEGLATDWDPTNEP